MKIIYLIAILIASLLAVMQKANANCYNTQNLEGQWKFSIGDNQQWAQPSFNDINWVTIRVPARWEEQGFHGYDGIAWYRKSVIISENNRGRDLTLELGYIDDCDEVFINGQKIGQSGSFPPNFSTAYNSYRKYTIPSGLVQFGQPNLIAVRVYDAGLEGGIVRGRIQICAGDIAISPDINLNGTWNFSTSWRRNQDNTIQVPGNWENQGYNDYNGVATYSRIVKLSTEQLKINYIFLAGRIDDDDEFFINGKLVGKTGNFQSSQNTDMHLEFRNYFIPAGILKSGDNLFEIKVLDRGGEGGIMEGNIGLITQDNFIKYWRLKRK